MTYGPTLFKKIVYPSPRAAMIAAGLTKAERGKWRPILARERTVTVHGLVFTLV